MAKPAWLSLNPTSGSGNGVIANSSSAHTGRVAREGDVTVTAVGVASPVTYHVIQDPLAEFVSFNNGSEMAADKTAGKLTIAGKSNSSKLTFAFVGDAFSVTLPTTYTAAGKATNNAAAITGDPGASAQYDFSIELDIPLNDTVDEVERTLKVTAAGAQTAQIVIKQAAGDARIAVSPESIRITQPGTAVNISVESNTTWTAS